MIVIIWGKLQDNIHVVWKGMSESQKYIYVGNNAQEWKKLCLLVLEESFFFWLKEKANYLLVLFMIFYGISNHSPELLKLIDMVDSYSHDTKERI